MGELKGGDSSENSEFFNVKRKRAYTEIESDHNLAGRCSQILSTTPPKSKSKKSKSISRRSKSYKSYDSEKTPLIKEEDPDSQSSGRNPNKVSSSEVKPFQTAVDLDDERGVTSEISDHNIVDLRQKLEKREAEIDDMWNRFKKREIKMFTGVSEAD